MKINLHNKVVWKSISIFLLTGIVLFFNQCVVQQYDVDSKDKGNKTEPEVNVDEYHDTPQVPITTGSGEFQESGSTEVAVLPTSVGSKDFEQIYMTFSVVTGIDVKDEGGIRGTFNDLNSQLPTDNSVKNYMTSHQIAIIKLASEFCHELFNDSKYYPTFFNNFDISKSPNQVLSTLSQKEGYVNEMIGKFWGVNVQPDNVVMTARDEMMLLLDDLLVGENMNSSGTTRKVSKGLCVSLLSSAPLVLL